ncbi:MAG TPA: hypothetical protein VHD60_01835 [Candidatus Saccharimonadales bacterium]|nr:hypothetical protein [Candidatus Saccharimonadales bacterium]
MNYPAIAPPEAPLRRNRLIVIGVVLVFFVALLFLVFYRSHPSSSQNIAAAPPQPAISVVEAYVQAREDQVGADQPSPTSWLAIIKPLTTSSWFTQLQPPSQSAGGAGADYFTAHTQGYVVKASLSNCVWNTNVTPTTTQGVISCALSDSVIQQSTGQAVPASSLPFGWTRNDRQLPVTIKVVNQSGKWLVDSDLSGQAS